jgi:hypothetical protein
VRQQRKGRHEIFLWIIPVIAILGLTAANSLTGVPRAPSHAAASGGGFARFICRPDGGP